MRLLVAEDDVALREALVRGLRQQAYAVDAVGDGAAALIEATVHSYDLLVVDVSMPIRDGISLCRELRAREIHTPILLLTARDSVEDRVAGLDAGADDYLVKPFVLDELFARLRALLRRHAVVAPNPIVVADLAIDTRAQQVWRGGQRVLLTPREYAFLEYLARHAGRLVSRTDLAAHVWDDNHDPGANLIDAYASRIRRKLAIGGGASLLHARRGSGLFLGLDPDEDEPPG